MKFRLELVFCCGLTANPPISTATPPRAEGRGSFEPSCAQRKREASSRSKPTGTWRPSLNSISEDGATVLERENRLAVRSDRMAKREVNCGPKRVQEYGYTQDYSRGQFSGVAASLSPSLFFF